jgi:hypothetical protein
MQLPAITLTQVLALTGALGGTAGLVLGILNYKRDKPRVRVTLSWDMQSDNDPQFPAGEKFAFVNVANTGRRPIYISHAAIKLPKGHPHTHLVLKEGLQGDRLAEGDPPKAYKMNQLNMGQYSKGWRKIRAVVFDSAGKEYKSQRPHWRQKPPSWVEGQN